MRPFYREMPYQNENPWGHVIFMVMAVIFWGVVIYGLVVLINRYARHHDTISHSSIEEPLQIAKARYAKGEITKDEFNQLKKDLS